ncbi:MAG: hypothetical protein QM731_13695 [Chitinophagaceae bacterium]
MSSFDDIKSLWQQQAPAPHPDAASMLQKARKDKQKIANKSAFQGIILLLTMVYIAWLGSIIHFKLTTTYISLALMILCLLMFGIIRIRQAIRLRNIRLDDTPALVLQQLEQFYKQQQLINTRGVLFYAIVLNIAFIFYFIEVLQPFSVTGKIISISAYTAWMLFALLVLGKRAIRKERARMNEIIQKIVLMEKGFSAE